MNIDVKYVFMFFSMVWRMRRHQNGWFRHHRQSDLIEARRLEKQVDEELLKRLVIVADEPKALKEPEPEQATLFDKENNDVKTN